MRILSKKFIIGFCLFIILAATNSCFLDRSGKGPAFTTRPSGPLAEPRSEFSWGADAFPAYACPSDEIVLKWNVGDPRCLEGTGPECQTLSVINNVGFPEYTSTAIAGEHSIGSVSQIEGWTWTNPLFTFSVEHYDENSNLLHPWENRTSYVEIIPDQTSSKIQEFRVGSACNTTSCQWRLDEYRLDMKDQSFINTTKGLGNCIRIASICYESSSNDPGEKRPGAIDLSIIESGETRLLGKLNYRECLDNLYLKPNLEYIVNPDTSIPLLPIEEGACCEGSGPGGSALTLNPFIDLKFTLICDAASDECR